MFGDLDEAVEKFGRVVPEPSDVETAHESQADERREGRARRRGRVYFAIAIGDVDRLPPFRLIPLEVFESEKSAGLLHFGVDGGGDPS